MAESKTKSTVVSVAEHIAAIAGDARRADCEELAALMARASGETARMWGTAIVGFGSYRYRYDSGREGESCSVGFASRKGDISIYGLTAGPGHEQLLERLGRHKAGKDCIYLRRLADVDLGVLEELVVAAVQARAGEGKLS